MKVIKRDGSVVPFDLSKIESAIKKASSAVSVEIDYKLLARKVASKINKEKVHVEEIQDLVEETLMESGYPSVAKAFILYRNKRAQARKVKNFLGVSDDLKLSLNAIVVLEKRYLRKDDTGKIVETPSQMFKRVAKAVADVDRSYGDIDADIAEEDYYRIMSELIFLPNSPTLMNAGTELGQLSACFVIPVNDSLEGIFDALKAMAIIQQSGGGTGFSFSRLRPKGDIVKTTMGAASGPVSFMKVFDVATDVIKQGGKRRGANMGILRADHPDIIEFINAKKEEGQFRNFNISVAATDEFMEAVIAGKNYALVNPRTGKKVKEINARDVFDLIVHNAWKSGDPGLVFIDEINRHNPTPEVGEIESTNPCGEQPLLPYESCNLGSINLSKFVKEGAFDYEKLIETIRIAVRFLDNVIDANRYPLKEIEKITLANRKIGLGVMGFSEALIKMNIPYDSTEALDFASKVSSLLTKIAREESASIAKRRGPFPNFEKSKWAKEGYPPLRNATVTTIAPTGTISIIAGTSSGIEPLFAVAFVRNILEGTQLLEINQVFEEFAVRMGFYSEELMLEVAKTGTVENLPIPEDVKRLFKTALEIEPTWHVRIQAAFQKNIDNAVSKTVNLREDSTPDEVRKCYLLAYKLKCKGITVYRFGSRKDQVIKISKETDLPKQVSVDVGYSGGCPLDTCPY
ncbi:MAG: adenosylcobalamin-dependent ribonucleoside-diphosphate reductase [Actinobacteria bacterium]|nr:adenosylcobalamin-dependent ribonucleoside-diphosphate reductase [Actinomycetota bacterium]